MGFMVQAILGIMGSQSLLHLGALSVRLSEGSLVSMAACSVRYYTKNDPTASHISTVLIYNI